MGVGAPYDSGWHIDDMGSWRRETECVSFWITEEEGGFSAHINDSGPDDETVYRERTSFRESFSDIHGHARATARDQ